jgi:serine/threonine protein kinase
MYYDRLCGYHPFDPHGTTSDNEMISCIKKCQFDFEDEAWIGISEGAKDLIRKLLVLDPTKRWSIQQVLTHPWITVCTVCSSRICNTLYMTG